MNELKPCPFCGGDAELKASSGRYGYFICAVCRVCDAQSKRFKADDDDGIFTGKAAEKATHFWDQRKEEIS